MKCPFCGNEDTRVSDKRETDDNSITRRRRECLKCKKRFTTYEEVERIDVTVIKKENVRQLFNPQKILSGMLKACEKRPISRDMIEEAVKEIEQEVLSMDSKEIPSKQLGELVMDKLKKLDKVAYIRFASVYKDFEDVADFKKELDALISKRAEK
ncbi:MAG TPA: transcriptional regulator NrdR [Candidatus Nanoarchaeia archaeon]|nr:transcriptional regulator NrdR [Candidatus Nanoarchaeia archaeon]